MRFYLAAFISILGLIGAASQSFAVVLTTEEEMYNFELKDAKARAKDFERLQKERSAENKHEAKDIEDYKSKVNSNTKTEEKEREHYVEVRNARPPAEREEVLEDRWNAEQEKVEELRDKDRARYISTQHRAQIAINENPETKINPMAEYDLKDPETPPLTDYLKAHPVKEQKPSEKIAPGGAIVVPGAKKLSSPPPGGNSNFDGF